tara:strand:+ start:4439 stop:4618 length:180 start_codon:yes stop_codon:yes gene_type:complete
METIELLAQTVNILNALLIEDDLVITDDDKQSWLDMAEAKLEQEGYSVIPFSSIWAKDT